jgi:hypothetical protein
MKQRIRITGIPPEEFLIARRATTLDDETPFCCHQHKVTASDLIAAGYAPELVESLPSDDGGGEFREGRLERRQDEDGNVQMIGILPDPASREIWLSECYVRIDEDGDGYAELRKIVAAGTTSYTILDDEPIPCVPIAALCPVPVPHKFFGLSVADLVKDIQLIRSTLLRSMLDNIYLQNNSRVAVVDGQVELDDLLTSRPGGIVRQHAPGMVEPLITAPLGPAAFNIFEALEAIRENRTGVTRYNQGLDASSLNQTATGISAIMGAAAARMELIARIFSEGGVRRLFKLLLKTMIASPMKEWTVRLRGEWVPFTPQNWNADMDVEVEVGLGVGQAAERIGNLSRIMEIQRQVGESPLGALLLTPDHIYRSTQKLAEAMGFKIEEQFFKDPQGQQAPPPQPDPRLVETERRREDDKASLALEEKKLQLQAMETQQEHDLKVREMELKADLEHEKIRSAERIALARERDQGEEAS